MSNMIKLHRADDNRVIYVRKDIIECIETEKYKDTFKTVVWFRPNNFLVNETPEKIYSLINEQ